MAPGDRVGNIVGVEVLVGVEVEVFVEGDPGNRLEDLRLHINEFSAGNAIEIQPVADDLVADNPLGFQKDEDPSRDDRPVKKILFGAKSEMLLEGRNRLTFHNASAPLTVLTIEVRVE